MRQGFWRGLGERLWAILGGVPVRTKILGMVLGSTLLLSAGIIYQIRLAVTQTMQAELQARGISVTRDLASRATDLILVNDQYGLHQLLAETQSNNPDVVYAFVTDLHGNVLADTFGNTFPIGLIDKNQVASQQHHHVVLLQTNEGRVWDVAVPIFNGNAGTARIGISNAPVEETFLTITSQVLLTTLWVLGLGLLVATLLTFILTRPILDLVSATQAVARGDFSRRVRRWANDEIGDLAQSFNTMAAELAHVEEMRREREDLRRQLLDKVITTQEDERRRISRELHDSTSQNLTSLMLGLKNMEAICNDERLQAQIDELRSVTSQTLEEVHDISMRLHPRSLDDLGLAAALERLTHEWQARNSLPVDTAIHIGPERLPAEIEVAIYRIVQESLTNAARHAQAHTVSLLVEKRDQTVVAVVEDDGIGFDSTAIRADGHLGLAGMRERAELAGGRLTIESAAGRGTSVFVQIPLRGNGKA